MIDKSQEELKDQRLIELAEVREYSQEEILDDLERGLQFTDIIIAGYQISGDIPKESAVMFAAVCELPRPLGQWLPASFAPTGGVL